MLLLVACSSKTALETPGPRLDAENRALPMADQRSHVHIAHQDERSDDYHWLRERNSPDVLAYLSAENAYTQTATEHLSDLRTSLYEEMKARLPASDQTAPVTVGDWRYFSRTTAGQSYPVHLRVSVDDAQTEEVLLDGNLRAEGHSYYASRSLRISPDHQRMIWAEDTVGNEVYTIYIKDLITGEVLGQPLEGTSGDVDWAGDSETFYFTTLDEAHRPHQLKRARVDGDGGVVDVYRERDPRFHIGIQLSRSQEYLILDIESALSTEVRVLSASAPTERFDVLVPRHEGVRYFVEHSGDFFTILSNDRDGGEHAANYRILRATTEDRSRSQWVEFIPARANVSIEKVDSFEDYLVIWEREDALTHLRIRSWDGNVDYRVDMPVVSDEYPQESFYQLWSDRNPEFSAGQYRFNYSSMLRPDTTFSVDLATGSIATLKVMDVGDDYDPTRYLTERHYVLSTDGVRVPVSIVFRRGTPKSGRNPLLLLGYGAYGFSYDAGFSLTRLSLIDRGVIVAIAHVRGGGDRGERWHETGRLEFKQNTFDDFVAVARGLILDRWTSPEHLAIRGGSAGGLLIGAAINQSPELFHAAVAEVPFVDVLTTMLDASIPLTANEWGEWGDPRDPRAYELMKSWSPYDNVKAQDYPNLLITAGLHDPRVQYWEPAKWTAKLRSMKTDNNLLLLKTTMDGGHGGQSGRSGWLEDEAFVQAFILNQLGWQGN